MTLNSTGLGIGTAPSANLHVNGNAIISEQLFVGGSSGSSNLNVNGTIGFGVQTVSSDTTLGDQTVIFADSSSDNLTLTLPYAGNVLGRVYTIKKLVSLNNLYVLRSSNDLIDSGDRVELLSGSMGSLSLISSAINQWSVISNFSANVIWTPEQLSTSAWFDASDTSTVIAGGSSNVYQWNDKSGNGNDVTQTTGSQQPLTGTRTMNGFNVIEFLDTSDQLLAIDSSLATFTEPEILCVVEFDTDGYLMDSFNGDRGAIRRSGGSLSTVTQAGQTNTGVPISTDPTMIYCNYNTSGGFLAVDGATPASIAGTYNTIEGLTLGSWSGHVTVFFNGIIGEFIITSGLSTGDRQKIEGYLSHKWGLEGNLPSSHPYKSFAP